VKQGGGHGPGRGKAVSRGKDRAGLLPREVKAKGAEKGPSAKLDAGTERVRSPNEDNTATNRIPCEGGQGRLRENEREGEETYLKTGRKKLVKGKGSVRTARNDAESSVHGARNGTAHARS